MAEDAARELPNLPLEDALQVVHLYFEREVSEGPAAETGGSLRYLSEGTPRLRDVAKVTASLASAAPKVENLRTMCLHCVAEGFDPEVAAGGVGTW